MNNKASFVNFPIWNACNLRCKFCYNDSWREKKQYFEDIEVLKKRLLKYHFIGKKVINIIWWEPLMHPKIFELFDFLKENNFILNMVTNWTRLWDLDFLESFLKYKNNFENITVSVHSHKELIEEKITWRKLSLEKKLLAIEALKLNNINFSLTMVLCNYNINYLQEIINFYVSNYNKKIWLQWMITGWWLSNTNIKTLPNYSTIIEKLNNFDNDDSLRSICWIPLCIHFKIKNKNYIIRELTRERLYALNWDWKNLHLSILNDNYIWDKCKKCFAFLKFCFWPWKIYVNKYWYNEFTSLRKEEVINLIKKNIKNKSSK